MLLFALLGPGHPAGRVFRGRMRSIRAKPAQSRARTRGASPGTGSTSSRRLGRIRHSSSPSPFRAGFGPARCSARAGGEPRIETGAVPQHREGPAEHPPGQGHDRHGPAATVDQSMSPGVQWMRAHPQCRLGSLDPDPAQLRGTGFGGVPVPLLGPRGVLARDQAGVGRGRALVNRCVSPTAAIVVSVTTGPTPGICNSRWTSGRSSCGA